MKTYNIISFMLFLLVLVCSAFAADQDLIGVWHGDDQASKAIYNTITISEKYISWPHTSNLQKCKAEYEVVFTESGDSFPDQLQIFKNSVKGRTFKTIKIKLEPKKCAGATGFLQFSFPSDVPGYADVVEYDDAGKPTGWMHFYKQK